MSLATLAGLNLNLTVFIGIHILCTATAIWLWKKIFRLRKRLTTPSGLE